MSPPTLHADIQAQCTAIFRALASGTTPDVDAAGLIARHGLDRVADFLTRTIAEGVTQVARKRGGHLPPEAILDDLFGQLSRGQSDELRDLVLSQVQDRRHPPIQDPKMQEAFLWGLLTLNAGTVIELAG